MKRLTFKIPNSDDIWILDDKGKPYLLLTKDDDLHNLAVKLAGYEDFEEESQNEKGIWNYSPNDDTVICSKCGAEHYLGSYRQFSHNYCPNCGSEMEF